MKTNYGALANKTRRAKEVKEIQENAKSEIKLFTAREFKLTGLMLYWSEGAKSKFVDFANSDPEVISLMIKWFRNICGVKDSRFRVQLHLHNGQDEKKMKQFWSSVTKLPLKQFHKSYVKPEGTGHRKNRLYYGTVKIRICDKNLLHKILGWIEGVKDQFRAFSSVGRAADSIKGPIHLKKGCANRVNSGKAKFHTVG